MVYEVPVQICDLQASKVLSVSHRLERYNAADVCDGCGIHNCSSDEVMMVLTVVVNVPADCRERGSTKYSVVLET